MSDDAELYHLLQRKLPPPRGTKKAQHVTILSSSPLVEEDIDILCSPHAVAAPDQDAALRIRTSHHRLAQLIADGIKQTEISLITGYSINRISILKNSPAFQELISHYMAQKSGVYVEVHERLADLGVTALEELRERLEEAPSDFTNRELLEVLEKTFDRSVAPSKGMKGVSAAPASGLTVNVQFTGKPSQDPVIIEAAQ